MNNVVKNGLVAAAFGAIISVSAFATANAAPAQQIIKHQKNTSARQEPRTTSSVDGTPGKSTPYQYSPKKPLNMACGLRFNPTSSSGCNY
ncbi:hypothetical protein FHX15_001280 [Rhizobium sp. BK650]|uniref:hypothetical protein n=1 Tax=Rhizobium sp. BK650 TaxID=2586990 RepID=UPI00161E043D|nr:hypothetical protein [Rhizobium sp. BK650]MBB3656067.1 hypothetical protein [Rhizobium sp. BK650]